MVFVEVQGGFQVDFFESCFFGKVCSEVDGGGQCWCYVQDFQYIGGEVVFWCDLGVLVVIVVGGLFCGDELYWIVFFGFCLFDCFGIG